MSCSACRAKVGAARITPNGARAVRQLNTMPLLEIDNVSVRFGGLKALSGFAFHVDAGELVGLIGPNGAGKTTAFNVATGIYPPTTGAITLNGQRIDGQAPVAINHAGIARTFQNIRLFPSLSVLDNVSVGFHRCARHGLAGTIARLPGALRERRRFEHDARQLLTTLRLADKAHYLASNLPYGDQRRLEIARALATRPKVLLLDEPAAGMNPQEKIELMALIRQVRDQFSVGIWLIEHDMKLIMSICQRITVLDHGEIIAVGTAEQVQNDPKVIEAYLGEPV